VIESFYNNILRDHLSDFVFQLAGKYVNGLIKLVKQTLSQPNTKQEVIVYFENTLKHIRIKQKTDERYKSIALD
jgi:hypothetical protein